MRNAKARDGQVVVLQEYEDYSQKREPCYLRPWIPRYLLTKTAALVDQVARVAWWVKHIHCMALFGPRNGDAQFTSPFASVI